MICADNQKATQDATNEGNCEKGNSVASDDHDSSTSIDDRVENVTKSKSDPGSMSKEREDYVFLRHATASIADALLQLGGSEDSCDTPSSWPHLNNNRKRALSYAADSATSSTEIDFNFTTSKRPRRMRSEDFYSASAKSCIPTPNRTCLPHLTATMKTKISGGNEENVITSFSTSEFQVQQHQHFEENKIPGDIGSISHLFHQDFRPLAAAPRMPRTIVTESPLLMNPTLLKSPKQLAPPATMSSAVITKHNDCFIMHSYTIVPRNMPHHMGHVQIMN
mmetsp:Transcript_25200/g.53729  ORF Transcript_25200/g.53729 Transcript_25200/m.53729 type:complete len:279 (-) Transcript_25200:307-1143(-)